MNIYAKNGDKVTYIGASETQSHLNGSTDPRLLLREGQDYTINCTVVHGCYTDVFLQEVPGKFNSIFFNDPVTVPLTIKDHISGFVTFICYCDGELWYKTETGLEFPVPILDTGNAVFLVRDKALLFMRWIRKRLENIEEGKREVMP